MTSGVEGQFDDSQLRAAAANGDVRAMHHLGLLAYRDSGPDDALRWHAEAARRGLADSIYQMGALLTGMGQAAAAEPWLVAAAVGGDSRAMADLASLYHRQNRPDIAAIWHARARAAGHGTDLDPAVEFPGSEDDAENRWDDGT